MKNEAKVQAFLDTCGASEGRSTNFLLRLVPKSWSGDSPRGSGHLKRLVFMR
jgi:hypothetical protein